jgi:tetratricopeptide (TPR) repeat protein
LGPTIRNTVKSSGIHTRAGYFSLVAAFLCLIFGASAAAMRADDYFEDGNRLFRDDLYWAALLRYRQAGEAGLDTPLLHFNTGVANYRAHQNIQAREALLLSLDSPTLRIGAQYNLGLNAYALGELDEALRWFRLARDQNLNPQLANYARIAIARIERQQFVTSPVVVRTETRREPPEFAHLDFRARVGFGTDSNAFRSPDQVYIDFADPTLPVITPEVKSGAFMPVSLSATYRVNAYTHEGFFGAYRLAGRYYQDKELENANEYIHELSFGSEYYRRDEDANREREVFSAFTVAQHDGVYYDPDDGGARSVNGVDVSDRMNYVRYGPELMFRQSHEHLSVAFFAKAQLWNYDTVEIVSEYDHEYFFFGVNVQYQFSKASLLRLTIDKFSRRFGDRPSFELDGTQIVGAPTVRYDYIDVTLMARQRLFRGVWFGVEYQRTNREDRYLGYNDYTRDSYGGQINWFATKRFNIVASAYYRLYDYSNAFAFNNPVVGRKTLEILDANLIATFKMTNSLFLVLEANLRERVSNDTRISYDRNQFVLGVRWEP